MENTEEDAEENTEENTEENAEEDARQPRCAPLTLLSNLTVFRSVRLREPP